MFFSLKTFVLIFESINRQKCVRGFGNVYKEAEISIKNSFPKSLSEMLAEEKKNKLIKK